MRWRLSDTMDAQKETTRMDAGAIIQHVVNCEMFQAPPPQMIRGHMPGMFYNAPEMDPTMNRIAPGMLSSEQFDMGRMTGRRPSGTFTSSSTNRPTEAQLQMDQNMPLGYEDYYR